MATNLQCATHKSEFRPLTRFTLFEKQNTAKDGLMAQAMQYILQILRTSDE